MLFINFFTKTYKTDSEEHHITADHHVISDDERMPIVVKDHDELREDLKRKSEKRSTWMQMSSWIGMTSSWVFIDDPLDTYFKAMF